MIAHLTLHYPCHDQPTTMMVMSPGQEGRRTCPVCKRSYRVRPYVRERKWFARWSEVTESFGPEVETLAT